jgi:adenylosuccinate synthase
MRVLTIQRTSPCEPVYETHPGWQQDLSRITRYDDLPAKAKSYLSRIAELAGARISHIGIGPAREQTLVV